jgi:signal transduction histidine kinase
VALDQAIDAEQAKWLHRTGPGLFVGQLLSAAVLAWLLWDDPQTHRDLLLWYAALASVSLVRWAVYLRFRGDPLIDRRGRYWLRAFAVGTAFSAAIWGYAGWHFFHPELSYVFPLGLVLATQIALSVPTGGVYFPAHAVFNLFAMSPFLVRNMLENTRLFWGQSLAIVILMIACLAFAWRHQATIRESIRLRLDNLDLLDRLKRENVMAEEARCQAEAANAAKSRFLAAASHDLRQPLQALSLFTQAVAEESTAGQVPSPDLVGKLSSSAESLQVMLDSLLDLSQSESGKLKVHVRDMPLQPLFDRVRREFSDQAFAKGLRLRVTPTRHYVRSDAMLLERMVRNLVSNALRYTEHGSILVACRRRARRLRIEVRDSGIGIPEAEREAIFHEFHQIANPERDRRKGLGLGLAIVNGLARHLGHRIQVRSAPGRGSVFAIELPAGEETVEETVPPIRALDHVAGRLLVVIDDDPQVREAMISLLSRWGCLVVAGEEAGEILDALRPEGGGADAVPAAILADWRLRDGRLGTDEARRLHEHFGRRIPTVLITGDTGAAVGDSGFPVLYKPVHGYRLRAQLDALLKRDAATHGSAPV